jgi:hypothetical protein
MQGCAAYTHSANHYEFVAVKATVVLKTAAAVIVWIQSSNTRLCTLVHAVTRALPLRNMLAYMILRTVAYH